MKRLTAMFLAFLAVSSMVAADPLYKWVDDQGNVHYSDKPQPGAKKVVLPKATTYNPPATARPHGTGSDAARETTPATGQESAAPAYTSLAISSPKDQDTIWNTDSVTVSVSVAPALQSGDSVSITVDGATQSVQGTSATFTGLDRGTHTVNAAVGTMKAAAVTFYIQKTSIKKPPTH
jgi:hypothetical protein